MSVLGIVSTDSQWPCLGEAFGVTPDNRLQIHGKPRWHTPHWFITNIPEAVFFEGNSGFPVFHAEARRTYHNVWTKQEGSRLALYYVIVLNPLEKLGAESSRVFVIIYWWKLAETQLRGNRRRYWLQAFKSVFLSDGVTVEQYPYRPISVNRLLCSVKVLNGVRPWWAFLRSNDFSRCCTRKELQVPCRPCLCFIPGFSHKKWSVRAAHSRKLPGVWGAWF